MFLAEVGYRPSSQHSLERVKNSLPYGPGNVKWATEAEQSRNRVTNVFLTFKGETKCLEDWAKHTQVDQMVLKYRLKHWTLEKALTTIGSIFKKKG